MGRKRIGYLGVGFLFFLWIVGARFLYCEGVSILKPSFYVSFEDTVEPVIAEGSKDIPRKFQWQFESGKIGKGLLVSKEKNSVVYYWAEANILSEKGTLCFWFKPDWSNEEDVPDEYRHFITVGTDGGTNFLFYWQKSNRAIYFATGGTDPADNTWKWNYSPGAKATFLKKGEWVHLAITWDKEKRYKAIYVNGSLAGESKDGLGVLLDKGAFHSVYIIIGGRSDKERVAPGIYDELLIYPECLGEEKIREIVKRTEPLLFENRSEGIIVKPLLIELGKPISSDGIVIPGEPFKTEIPIKNISSSEFKGEITYQLIDYWGNVIEEKKIFISLKPGESIKEVISFTVNRFGPYKIRAKYIANTKKGDVEYKKDVFTFGCVPEDLIKRGPKQNSFFGHHPNMFGQTKNLDICKKIGVKWVRSLDMIQSTWWWHVEPSPGNFEFKLEKDINLAIDRGMNILGVFFWTPKWAARLPENFDPNSIYYRCYPPKDWDIYRRYVEKTVEHYKDRIKYWEAWNEPNHTGCWRGSNDEYVKLLQITYETVRKTDPSAKILGMGGTSINARKWNEDILSKGALKYMDIFDVHPVFSLEQTPEKAQNEVEEWYELMDRYGERKPIWFTESGLTSTTFFEDLELPQLPPIEKRTPPLNYREGAETLVKTYCSWISRGVQKHFFYYMREMSIEPHRAYVDYGMAEITGVPKPMGFSYAAMAYLLEDMTWKTEWQRTKTTSKFIPYDWKTSKIRALKIIPPDLLLRGHIFVNDQKTTVVLWAEPGGKIELTLPKNTELRDIMGNLVKPIVKDAIIYQLTEEPCYFIFKQSFKQVCKILENAEINIIKSPVKAVVKEESFDSPGTEQISNYLLAQEALMHQWLCVDIKKFTNMGFADDVAGDGKGGWTDEGPNNDLRTMPVGKQKFYGVPFDIIDPAENNGKSIIVLKSQNSPLFPTSVNSIPVNKKSRAIYFLHSSAWTRPEEIAHYLIRYEDGETLKVPVIGNQNIADWWTPPLSEEVSKPVPVKVEPILTKNPWRYIRVFEWLNPWPEKKILSIDFVSEGKLSIPILIGITVYTLD